MDRLLTLHLIALAICAIHCDVVKPPPCPPNEIYKTCQSSSCSDLPCNATKPLLCTLDCVSKCFCQDGFERNEKKECVACPPTCPKNEVWSDCLNPCRSEYCKDPIPSEPTTCIKICKGSGCVCLAGLRRNENKECVKC